MRPLRAFVSYRRNDAFMQSASPDGTSLITRLAAALRQLGCIEVFVDTAEIRAGDYFEGRIYRAISACDLFIPLIGRDWVQLLAARGREPEPDFLVRELEAAFALEKDVVPLLIDGASMPRADELPATVRELANVDAKPLASDATVEAIVAALASAAHDSSRVRRLGRRWATGYTLFAFLVWVLCAVVPNAVGLAEFGYDPWVAMAAAWAGMFIWPLFFLPFVLLALYRPFQVLLEATLNAESTSDSMKYASPLILGILIAIGVTLVEIGPPQVPWSIHPKLRADCSGPAGPTNATQEYDHDRLVLASYGVAGVVPERLGGQFWMKDKCWPNVFFYMTVPRNVGLVDSTYAEERATVQKAFLRMLAIDSNEFKGTEAPYSLLFPLYALAFFLIIGLFSAALLMAMIYTRIAIRRPRDGRILQVPNEDAFLCLMYGFITVLIWIPFRLTTNGIKWSYNCVDFSGGCGPVLETFMKDLPFSLTLLLAYLAVTAGILWNHKRLLLGSLATVVVCLIIAGTLVFYTYHSAMSRLTGYWQFWLAVSLLANLMLIALWYQFDPAIVRFRDFQRGGGRRVRRRDGRLSGGSTQ